MRLAWVSSWDRVCGIAEYSRALFPAVRAGLAAGGDEASLVSLDEYPSRRAVTDRLRALAPDLVHFQHEYSLYGGKSSPRYWFPGLVRGLAAVLPGTRRLATAHTVLPRDYRLPLLAREPAEVPLRLLANQLLRPLLAHVWGRATWGGLDAVVVHSERQVPVIESVGVGRVAAIPLFVPAAEAGAGPPGTGAEPAAPEARTVLVFGFFGPEKGQDIAIAALSRLGPDTRLVLAGSARRPADRWYLDRCMRQARRAGVAARLEVTGYVEVRDLAALYRRADLVLLPFRETSGSASLVQAFAHRAAILASDLPLNQEVEQRVPGCLALFRSEDVRDCAARIAELLADPARRRALQNRAHEYARRFGAARIAERHVALYRELSAPPPAAPAAHRPGAGD